MPTRPRKVTNSPKVVVERLAANYCRNSVDFARNDSPASVVDRLNSENFTLNSHALTCELKQVWLTMYVHLLPELRAHATITGGISSRGMKARFIMRIFEIEYGQQGMRTRLKSKTEQLRPEKCANRFMESPRVPCCYNASSEGFIQCIMIHQGKLGSLG
jgi:hypothetical protein